MRVVISSGHGEKIRGASGKSCGNWGLDEVDEARRVVDQVADFLVVDYEIDVEVFHDDVSTTQDENLQRIVQYHNSKGPHDLDVSVHFNAYECTSKPMGAECFHHPSNESTGELSEMVSAGIAEATGLPDRGAKDGGGLYFINNTDEAAILIEVCFVDSSTDADRYRQNFIEVCHAIAGAIAGEEHGDIDRPVRPPEPEPPPDALFYAKGTCSWFGGPEDDGVSPSEGLAFFYDPDECPHLLLPYQPAGTSGLARRLDPGVFYVACRWDYDVTPKDMLRNQMRKALVRANGKEFLAYPADWGPHEEQTGRAADLSPALMEALGATTDDIVEVIYPAPEE